MSQAVAEIETPLQEAQTERAPHSVSEEKTVYLISRRREVRCRLWYEVTPLREGMSRYFLTGIQILDQS